LIEIILGFIFGLILGTVTGLIPGLHINLAASIFLVVIPLIYSSPLFIITVIPVAAITHVMMDFIPSLYLGVPEESTVLIVQPGHKLVQKGLGKIALYNLCFGAACSFAILTIFLPIWVYVLGAIFDAIKNLTGLVLTYLVINLILSEKNKMLTAFLVILSGILGYLAFRLPIKDPLLPLLSGLFGSSLLIRSLLLKRQKFQSQKAIDNYFFPKKIFFTLKNSSFAILLTGLFPGIGPTQATLAFASKKRDPAGWLFMIGGITAGSMAFSVVTLYTIGKGRNGAFVLLSDYMGELSFENFILLWVIIILAGAFSIWMTLKLSDYFVAIIHKINFQKLQAGIIFFTAAASLIISGWIGLCIWFVSVALGLYTQLKGIPQHIHMASLMIPIIFYLIN